MGGLSDGAEQARAEAVRQRVIELAEQRGDTLSGLSRRCGQNVAYLSNFIHRGSPRRLPEDVRLALAMHWQIDERELGARDPWRPGS